MRAVVPNLFTAARIPLGAAAIVAATGDRLGLAATLITLGGVTDGVDGWVARRLGLSSSFGALFDCFCDYLCFVVAPWMVARALLSAEGSAASEIVLMLPLLTGAIRYARNGLTVSAAPPQVGALPGLGTVFFAFLIVTAVFLDGQRWVDARAFDWGMTTLVAVFSILMVTPIPYPKLTTFRGASPAVIVLLAIMPFFGTRQLALVMLVIGLLYVVAGPLLARKQGAPRQAPARAAPARVRRSRRR